MKVAIVGAGCSGMGHLLSFEMYAPGSVIAVCDPDRSVFDETLANFRRSVEGSSDPYMKTIGTLRCDLEKLPFYDDFESLLAHHEIDTVAICSYCCTHAQMVEIAVRHNLNILLEKPVAISEADVERIWELLRNYPKVATVNFTMRGAPVTRSAQRHVADGDLGRLVSVQYINNVHYGDGYFRKWMRTRQKIGSLFLQKATHDFDIINSILRLRPQRIAAFGSRRVYGGSRPNDLHCDECPDKWHCPQSSFVLKFDADKYFPPRRERLCVFASEIDIDDNQTVIIQYENGVNVSYSQTFCVPHGAAQRGGVFIGDAGTMKLEYYGEYVDGPVGKSHLDVYRNHAKTDSVIHEVHDWAGRSHFDGTDYGFLAKLALLRGEKTEIANSVKEGYISAKMCLAAQRSIEEGRVIELDLNLRDDSQ